MSVLTTHPVSWSRRLYYMALISSSDYLIMRCYEEFVNMIMQHRLDSSIRGFHKMYNNDNIDKIDINVNFVFPYLCSFLLNWQDMMLINVKLDITGFKSITFWDYTFHWQETAKTKLTILSFLYCSEFVKTSITWARFCECWGKIPCIPQQ